MHWPRSLRGIAHFHPHHQEPNERSGARAAVQPQAARVDAFLLAPHAWVPNNRSLPVIVYSCAFDPGARNLGDHIDHYFAQHDWPVQWHDGVFDYHHFHSTAHEVLGVIAGAAELIVGGPGGRPLRIAAGDVLLLPAGTGHCLVSREDAFQVAGGYPKGQQWDIRRDALTPDELRAMDALPFPACDPVYGKNGPLIEQWTSQA